MADNKVWLSTPVSFNDPFDCAINLDRSKLAESVAHAVEKATQNAEVEDSLKVPSEEDELAYERLRDGLGSLMQNIGVFCLSEAPDEILMWSHYAENHKGFCIEYKIDETSPLTTMARPVKYTDVYPSLSVKNLHAGATEAFLEACLFTKAKQWSYEKEWRAIMDVGGKLYQAPAPVSAIIFGARMPEADKRDVYEILRLTPGIEFREAFLLDSFFGLGFRPYVTEDNR
ncbi:DUF2971 domain-containing protein [Pseudomonas sp. p99-361]|uniref:DUF2971 domain-containing protein n=2 Tax=Pseudomonas TaxID=286 RepID=A0A7W2LL26_9PSED|nr:MULTISPECIES: DUF2971 domain-containing protein [Pseudomonas]PPB16794.1 DUF2971 domain-containing protein [Pseudomonas aeruginosa]QEQ88107.1 DUF2971 domain-containing protein [Pseudomonas putida]AYN16797.1 DUF2971 domain-containing protein [Pseudomonas monteilii]AYN99585.1 DUF2971 domain-containing protein [Pseudomonas sp. LTGT-11-2Z]MBA6142876.1 DUF2971 domain-containing protein [Pseudomonas juntendi]